MSTQRTLKFRVWDGQRMHNVTGQGLHLIFWNDPTRIAWGLYDASDAKVTDSQYGIASVMQYTGLKDKNGKEIYEGDILGGYPHGEAWVEYDSKYACWAAKWYGYNPDWDGEDPLTEHVTCSDLLCNQMEDCGDAWQVIGNIHENPELTPA